MELFETFFFLVNVLLLELLDLLLPRVTLLRFGNGVLLTRDDSIGTGKKSFNFFFVGVLDGRVHRLILLVLAVQVEDHFGQLGDLLRHLVMVLVVHLASLVSTVVCSLPWLACGLAQ